MRGNDAEPMPLACGAGPALGAVRPSMGLFCWVAACVEFKSKRRSFETHPLCIVIADFK